MLSQAMDAFLNPGGQQLEQQPRRTVDLQTMVSASNFMTFRYAHGHAVLDNDIARQAWLAGKEFDVRDEDCHAVELGIRYVLCSCPAHVLTLPLIACFCSKQYAGLTSNNPDIFEPALARVQSLFDKMQEYSLGRILGAGRALRFQKKHLSALTTFALE